MLLTELLLGSLLLRRLEFGSLLGSIACRLLFFAGPLILTHLHELLIPPASLAFDQADMILAVETFHLHFEFCLLKRCALRGIVYGFGLVLGFQPLLALEFLVIDPAQELVMEGLCILAVECLHAVALFLFCLKLALLFGSRLHAHLDIRIVRFLGENP